MTFSPCYKIGAYTVVRMLGQGGMGDVYEVVHGQLGTHYAIKAFASKKMVKGKYLRVGRDSKTNKPDWFHLNKVIIYGK